jgi:hypothetical protein
MQSIGPLHTATIPKTSAGQSSTNGPGIMRQQFCWMLKVDIPLKQPEGGQLWQSKPSNFRLSDIQMYLLPPHPQHFPAFSSVHLSLHPFKLCPICDICWMAASVLSKSCNPQRHPRWARGLGRTVSTTSMLGTKHHDDQPKPSCGW